MFENENQIPATIPTLNGSPFYSEVKQDEERIYENDPDVKNDLKLMQVYTYNPFPKIDDSIELNFQKPKDETELLLKQTASQVEVPECNGICVIYADGCCHCEPMEESGYVKKVIK